MIFNMSNSICQVSSRKLQMVGSMLIVFMKDLTKSMIAIFPGCDMPIVLRILGLQGDTVAAGV